MARKHEEQVSDLEDRHRELTIKFEASEADLKEKIRLMSKHCDELEEAKARNDKENTRLLLESQKNLNRHEEEV